MSDEDDGRFASIHERVRFEMALDDVKCAIRMAEVRAQPFNSLLDRLSNILEDPDREQIIYHLGEIELDAAEADALARKVEELSSSWEQLPSRKKARADAILARLIRALPDRYGSALALTFLTHRRKKRREGAYKFLRTREIPVELARDLVVLAETTDDQELLHLIARNPAIVAATDERYLLERIEDSYWRMRVVEALLLQEPDRAVALAVDYPIQFIHAVGRREAAQHLPLISELFVANRADPDVLGIYAWALGRIGNLELLREVRAAMEDLRQQLEEPGA